MGDCVTVFVFRAQLGQMFEQKLAVSRSKVYHFIRELVRLGTLVETTRADGATDSTASSGTSVCFWKAWHQSAQAVNCWTWA